MVVEVCQIFNGTLPFERAKEIRLVFCFDKENICYINVSHFIQQNANNNKKKQQNNLFIVLIVWSR
jgi:hypothetical protein